MFFDYFQIVGVGSSKKKFEVRFYGDRTLATVGRSSITPFNSNIDVKQHLQKRGYAKAIKEALIDGIRAMEETRRTVERNAAEFSQSTQSMQSNDTMKVKAKAVSANIRDTVETNSHRHHTATQPSSFGRVTRSKNALTPPVDMQSECECETVIQSKSKTKTKTKTARNMRKEKNCVRRSERLRRKFHRV